MGQLKKHNTNKNKKLNVQPFRTNEEISTAVFFLSKNKMSKRDKLLFLFGINTGLRASDIVVRKVKEVRFTKNPYIIEQKTNKRRQLSLNNIGELIDDYIKDMNDDDYLFPSYNHPNDYITRNGVYQIFKKLEKQMDRNDLGTHTMRKTFGYHFYKKTHDIGTLMKILNHSNQAITKRYIGITDDEIKESLSDFSLGI